MPDQSSNPEDPSTPDVVDVIDRAALIENIINQIIIGYCKPRESAWHFMWSVLLDTSVMPLGSKVKVALAISHEMNFPLDKNHLHRVISLRNAFAHHATNAHPVLSVGRTPDLDSSYLQLIVLESSGKISRMKRHEAFAEFNRMYLKARDSLAQLNALIHERYP